MVETHALFSSTLSLLSDAELDRLLGSRLNWSPLARISNVYGETTNLGSKYDQMYSKVAKIMVQPNGFYTRLFQTHCTTSQYFERNIVDWAAVYFYTWRIET